jgi:glutaredoxin
MADKHEINLEVTLYVQPECKQSEDTFNALFWAGVPLMVRDITKDPSAREDLLQEVPHAVTPTVVARCNCSRKHVEKWSSHIEKRNSMLVSMVKHLQRINSGEIAETLDANAPDDGPESPTPPWETGV